MTRHEENQALEALKVGDSVAVVKSSNGDGPVEIGQVTHVTKRFVDVDGVRYEKDGGLRPKYSGQSYRRPGGYIRPLACLQSLRDSIAARVQSKAQQQAERDEELAKAEARRQAQIAEVKALIGESVVQQLRQVMPDGSALYVVNIPVKPENAERTGGWRVLMVKVKDRSGEESLWDKDKPFEMTYAYCSGGSGGFSSSSSDRHISEHDAVWEAIRSARESWGW